MLGFSPLANSMDNPLPGSVLNVVSSGFMNLSSRQRQQLLIHLFHKWLTCDIHEDLSGHYVPFTFLPLLANAMKVLCLNKKKNLLHLASRCFGELRPEEDIPRMPLDRMPFGLIEHNLSFFASDNVDCLQAPDDYKAWCQSMYTLFGNKWAAMHCGPMWHFEKTESSTDATPKDVVSQAHEEKESSTEDTTSDILSQAIEQTFGSDVFFYQGSNDVTVSTANLSREKPANQNALKSLDSQHVTPSDPSSGMSDVSCNSTFQQAPASTLWSTLSEGQRREEQLTGSISQMELENMHGVRPVTQVGQHTEKKPLKV